MPTSLLNFSAIDISVLTSTVGSLDKIAPSPFAFFTGGGDTSFSASGSSAIGELSSAREVQVEDLVTSNSNSAVINSLSPMM